ncbi:hypothetical protein PR001_g5087 [Phytophthora rubi]|uniref:Uncharacterized protein n=1 Tax=Phytophthora rubi TaxID=129364 RepID=A0A6A3NKY8_9STRA|nr:hypothetical protein PR001_g5087 [Phytophthora rubi]
MTPFAANPASPADDQRDTPSTVEDPPADTPAADPSDSSDSTTVANRPATASPGSSRNAHRPLPASAGPALSAASQDDPVALGDAAASPARGRLSATDISSSTTTHCPPQRSPTWLAASVLAPAPSSRPAYSALSLPRSRASAPPAGPLRSSANPAPVPRCLTEPGAL